MQFKGTFAISEFRDFQTNKARISKSYRQQFKIMYLRAVGESLLDVSQYIPMLTGEWRRSVKEILTIIDTEINKLGGRGRKANYAGNVDLSPSMTESLWDTMGTRKPRGITSKKYKGKYWHLQNITGYRYRTRQGWQKLVRKYGYDSEYDAGAKLTRLHQTIPVTRAIYTLIVDLGGPSFKGSDGDYANFLDNLRGLFEELVALNLLKQASRLKRENADATTLTEFIALDKFNTGGDGAFDAFGDEEEVPF